MAAAVAAAVAVAVAVATVVAMAADAIITIAAANPTNLQVPSI